MRDRNEAASEAAGAGVMEGMMSNIRTFFIWWVGYLVVITILGVLELLLKTDFGDVTPMAYWLSLIAFNTIRTPTKGKVDE